MYENYSCSHYIIHECEQGHFITITSPINSRIFARRPLVFTRCSKLRCGVRDMFSCSLLSAAKCKHDRYGTLNTKRLAFIRTIDEQGRPRKPVRAAGPLVEALLSYTSIHGQSCNHPRGDGNSRIIPISSGNFVAQFVSRKEYDITRIGRIAAT